MSDHMTEMYQEALALSALPSAPMPAVKVKPLKEKTQGWKDDKGRFCLPFSEGYFIKFPPEKGGLFMVWFFTNPIAGYAGLKDAIAAANAHHEARILSALDVPAHPEGVKALRWEGRRRDAEASLAEAKRLLKPFADARGYFDGHVKDEDLVYVALRNIRASHVRAAARFLAQEEGHG